MKNIIKIIVVLVVVALIIFGAFYFFNSAKKTSISVLSPKAGTIISTGSIQKIEWKSNISPSQKISVSIRRIPPPPLQTEGQEFDPLIFTNLPNTGSADWIVSDMYPEGSYVLGITAYDSVPVNNPISAESEMFTIKKGALVGGDKDEHGCIGSAGYSWCGAKNMCIRPWEKYCSSATQNRVVFKCDASKSVTATFYLKDDKFVDLELSDGRKLSVPHAISASGARYAKPDESFVFWNKGDTAFITEGDPNNPTYANCAIIPK